MGTSFAILLLFVQTGNYLLCKGRVYSALWSPAFTGKELPLTEASCLEHRLNQSEHSTIRYSLGQQCKYLLVVHRPEKVLQVSVHDPLPYIRPCFVEHWLIDADYTGRAGLHAFRHALATVLIVEEKVDPKTAQGILRHTDAGLTMNIYTHAQDPAKRAALERFESHLVQ